MNKYEKINLKEKLLFYLGFLENKCANNEIFYQHTLVKLNHDKEYDITI